MIPDKKQRVCQYRTLAQNGVAHVQACVDCGTVSLHMGAVSLRFEPAALESLWNTVGKALIALHEHVREDSKSMLTRTRPIGDA